MACLSRHVSDLRRAAIYRASLAAVGGPEAALNALPGPRTRRHSTGTLSAPLSLRSSPSVSLSQVGRIAESRYEDQTAVHSRPQ